MIELREAMRGLLLPIDPAREDLAVAKAAETLSAAEVSEADHGELVRIAGESWRDERGCDPMLAEVITAAIREGDLELGESLASRYLDLHTALQEAHHYSFAEASAFLSHARLAAHLAIAEKMSSAQTARVLAAQDQRADFHWQAVETLLTKLGIKPRVLQAEVDALLKRDRAQEEALFADAGIEEAAALVGEAAAQLGFDSDLSHLLGRIVDPDLAMHGPYLKMLFYQCLIAESYDHALTWIYEFNPRGRLAEHVFNDVLGDIEGGSKPFLDNAKSVDRLDLAWARAKKSGELDRATALAEVLQKLEEMGFAARQELAGWLRPWVLRVARLTMPRKRPVEAKPAASEVRRIMAAVSAGETHTTGIIEQRMVDAIAASLHPVGAGWRASGLGDSVNASNVSRRKIGDCEFQHSQDRRVIAYEAHAGRLSDVYLSGHVATLHRVIPLRVDEWQRIADLDEWRIEVLFIAHEGPTQERTVEIEGARIAIRCLSFEELIAMSPDPRALRASFTLHVSAHLNEQRTPQRAREAYLRILSGKPR
jgi:hypothetical protein